ncbi:GMC oxidoreductase [Thermomonospora catenispora]|uniref:GMC oxidoreductase n=1 Tax=Thermomonospora catenispora TaxID=2493090 RepID=UPI00111F4C01|nr:GMC family oxidoreductase [Thermomonospora catenispora]TNY37067.1 GMC family oxidoreductase [Thermomonospora catenispora]
MGERVREHVDAVVVGSGFGGSVAAYRLAEAGRSVVVLERGQAFPPGSFPRSPAEMSRAFWDPRAGLHGMYDVWHFSGCDSVVASGLGGGSLIYANVLLRKDERWFVHEHRSPDGGYEPWPISRADLDPHYDAVERMLGATPYPLEEPAYADTPKTQALQDAAAELGLDWFLPPLAVSFAPEPGATPGIGLPIAEPWYGNLHGLPRRTCRLCAECDIGCNDGSKNSLDHTYLSAARYYGADLRTSHEVTRIRPRSGGGYEVDYVRHEPGRESRDLPVHTIGCDRLILAAGTYGTTYLLLRSRDELPGLSPALGTRFCGNGDLLTFLLRARDRDRIRPLVAGRGPVITSAIRLPDEVDGDPCVDAGRRGAYIQEGGYPEFVSWMVESADVPERISRALRFLWDRVTDLFSDSPDNNLSAELSELIGDGALSVSSLPLLGMGRDTPDGVMRLDGDMLRVTWNPETSAAHFERLRTIMQRIGDVLGAEYQDNPIWFRKRIITVHPLGGAPIGRHPGEGVCDPYGEVFGHPGLYVADGAAMPGPVGANPSLTIAAMADRMCSRLLDTGAGPAADGMRGSFATGPVLGKPGASLTSLSFTEEMKGHWTPGVADPRAGEKAEAREPLAFRLTITADDLNRFLDDPEHTARAEGWVEAARLGGRRPVSRGWFNLFAPTGRPDRRVMRYRLHLDDAGGRPVTLVGHKDIQDGPPTRIWPDTSTLYVRLLEGHVQPDGDDEAPVLGAGVLHIRLEDFITQLTTFRAAGPGAATALARFGAFFAGQLWRVYGPDD